MKLLLEVGAKRFYGNQHVKRYFRNPFRKYVINPTVKATKVTGFIIVSVFVIMLVANILHSAWFENEVTASEIATSTPESIAVNPEFPDFPPALVTICTAESGGKHIDPATGKVVRGHVDPDDIGICQINQTYWADEAHELGFDLWEEEGNKKMAKWLFYKYGTEPWNPSKPNWIKKIWQN